MAGSVPGTVGSGVGKTTVVSGVGIVIVPGTTVGVGVIGASVPGITTVGGGVITAVGIGDNVGSGVVVGKGSSVSVGTGVRGRKGVSVSVGVTVSSPLPIFISTSLSHADTTSAADRLKVISTVPMIVSFFILRSPYLYVGAANRLFRARYV